MIVHASLEMKLQQTCKHWTGLLSSIMLYTIYLTYYLDISKSNNSLVRTLQDSSSDEEEEKPSAGATILGRLYLDLHIGCLKAGSVQGGVLNRSICRLPIIVAAQSRCNPGSMDQPDTEKCLLPFIAESHWNRWFDCFSLRCWTI